MFFPFAHASILDSRVHILSSRNRFDPTVPEEVRMCHTFSKGLRVATADRRPSNDGVKVVVVTDNSLDVHAARSLPSDIGHSQPVFVGIVRLLRFKAVSSSYAMIRELRGMVQSVKEAERLDREFELSIDET